MANRCPKCGAGLWDVRERTTLVYGPNNETIYHCNNCGYEWIDVDCNFVKSEIKTKYKEIKDWLVENYCTREDVDVVYGALCNLLDTLDEHEMNRM